MRVATIRSISLLPGAPAKCGLRAVPAGYTLIYDAVAKAGHKPYTQNPVLSMIMPGMRTAFRTDRISVAQNPMATAPYRSPAVWNTTEPQSVFVFCMSSPHAMPSVKVITPNTSALDGSM